MPAMKRMPKISVIAIYGLEVTPRKNALIALVTPSTENMRPSAPAGAMVSMAAAMKIELLRNMPYIGLNFSSL